MACIVVYRGRKNLFQVSSLVKRISWYVSYAMYDFRGWIKYTSYSGDFVPSPPTNFSNRISLLSMINKGSSRFSYFLATPPLLSFENPNYFCEWGRWQEGRKDYVTFSCRITPDACFSLCLQVSDPTSVSLEPLPATGKGGRQEGERGGKERERERERGVFVGDSKVEMNCRHQQP